ncbi:hypothetical protein ACVIGA_005684 [Bradyrhizobium sp. USDA 3240]
MALCHLNNTSTMTTTTSAQRSGVNKPCPVRASDLGLNKQECQTAKNSADFAPPLCAASVRLAARLTGLNSSIRQPSADIAYFPVRQLPECYIYENVHERAVLERHPINIDPRNAAETPVGVHDVLPQPHRVPRQLDESNAQTSSRAEPSADQASFEQHLEPCIRLPQRRIQFLPQQIPQLPRPRLGRTRPGKPFAIQPHHLWARALSLPQR